MRNSLLTLLLILLPLPTPAADAPNDWRPLPLIKDNHPDPAWTHLGYGGFTVENNTLRTSPSEKGLGLLLYRPETFGNCQLRITYKPQNPNCNSGIYVRIDPAILDHLTENHSPGQRTPDGKLTPDSLKAFQTASEKQQGPWYAVHHGYEVQIQDKNDPYHRTGAIYSLAKAAPLPPAKDDGWRTMTITLNGDKILIDIDGKRITTFDPASKDIPKDRQWFEPRRDADRPQQGYIGLQNHDPGDIVYFKEVAVRALPAAP